MINEEFTVRKDNCFYSNEKQNRFFHGKKLPVFSLEMEDSHYCLFVFSSSSNRELEKVNI
jgi:hypothetical protein